MFCPSGRIPNLPGPARPTVSPIMVLPMVGTTADRLPVTMDDLNAQAILATDLFLVVEPLREGLVQ